MRCSATTSGSSARSAQASSAARRPASISTASFARRLTPESSRSSRSAHMASNSAAIPAGVPAGVLAAATSPGRREKLNFRKLLLAGAAIVVLAGASWYGYDYWTVGQYLVSTDDAYVKADNTTIAPKVSGYLNQVLVADNEHVKAGQVLARIDDRDFRVALDQAHAEVQAANATVSSKEAQL